MAGPTNPKLSVLQVDYDRWPKAQRFVSVGWPEKQNIDPQASGKSIAKQTDRLETIDRAMDLQQMLYEVSQITNDRYGFQTLVVIATAFIMIVFDSYNILDLVTNRKTKTFRVSFADGIIMLVSEIAINVSNILGMVIVCTLLRTATMRTGTIVHKIMVVSRNPTFRERMSQFSMQLNDTIPTFDAMGLFNIDGTLVYSMAGAITTYLIILVQYTNKKTDSAIHIATNLTQPQPPK